MSKLENLPEVSGRVLSELKADERMKNQILQKAKGGAASEPERSRWFRPVPVLCSVAAVMVLFVALLNGIPAIKPGANPGKMIAFTAGDQPEEAVAENMAVEESDIANQFPDLDADKVMSIEISAQGAEKQLITDQASCAKLVHALKEDSVYTESAEKQLDGVLVIATDDMSYRFEMADPYLKNENGCWKCAAFFELLRNAE